MQPLARKTVAATLTHLGAQAAELFVVLSQTETKEFDIVRVERKELAKSMKIGITSISAAYPNLKASRLLQRHGRIGYLIRKK